MFKRLVVIALSILILSVVTACSQQRGLSALENYDSRLENIFEEFDWKSSDFSRADLVNDVRAIAFPSGLAVGVLEKNNTSGTINILDFLSLHGCRLQETIANMNNNLGKVAEASQRLLSDMRFVKQAPECITMLMRDGEPELAETLTQAMKQKRTHIPKQFAQTLFNGDEYAAFWRAPSALEDYPSNTNVEPAQALAKLEEIYKAWSKGRYLGDDSNRFETQLFHVMTGDGGSLLTSIVLVNYALERINYNLQAVFKAHIYCTPQSYSVAILKNVVEQFFAQDVQVWLADVNRRRYAIMPRIHSLEAALSEHLSEEYLSWIERREALFDRNADLVKAHVTLLSALMDESQREKRCM